MATVDAMQSANKEMKKQYKNINIDKIEVRLCTSRVEGDSSRLPCLLTRSDFLFTRAQSIHYDMEDLIDQANEIQESLGRSYGVPEEIDEADLQAGKRSGDFPTDDRLGADQCRARPTTLVVPRTGCAR
jgi:charged multivesicular body protein 5